MKKSEMNNSDMLSKTRPTTQTNELLCDIHSKICRTSLILALVFMVASLAQAATFHVTTTADNNNNANPTAGSLRKAIVDANANPGTDTIDFNISGAGVHIFSLTAPLPNITDPVVIDGYTQPGASPNTLANGDNAVLLIELTGTNIFNFSAFYGLVITGSDSTVKGLIINGFIDKNTDQGSGIKLASQGNVISGNFIGTNAGGSAKISNSDGILIDGASNNTIGGSTPAARNVISGNKHSGIAITNNGAAGNQVQGNFIGTDRNGTAALGNGDCGVVIGPIGNTNPDGVTVGGTTAGAGNVISANGVDGIALGKGGTGLTVQGNLIGTDVTGKAALANGSNGISIFANVSYSTKIGGQSPAARNIISGNKGSGILLYASGGTFVYGNYIGTDISGNSPLGNTQAGITITSNYNMIGEISKSSGNVISANGEGISISNAANGNFIESNLIGYGADGVTPLGNKSNGIRINSGGNVVGGDGPNSIAFNGGAGVLVTSGDGNWISANSITANLGLGIDLFPPNVTANDQGDGDSGPNGLQNTPVITRAVLFAGSNSILTSLNSTPNTKFFVEFFANSACDPSGSGEGEVLVGTIIVTTDASGNVSFGASLKGLTPGQFLTATARDAAGNTSEFSQCTLVQNGISISDYSHAEGNTGTTLFNFTVSLEAPNPQPIKVDYATFNGGAQPGSDYQAANGTLTFAPGETSKQVTVLVNGDAQLEQDEAFFVNLSNPVNASILQAMGAGIIVNDDAAQPGTLAFSAASYNVNENGGQVTITVTRSGGSDGAVSIEYATFNGTATAGSDYPSTTGSLNWADGDAASKTFVVPITNDSSSEADETVNLTLSNPGGGATAGNPSSAALTIVDDDGKPTSPTIQFGQATYSVQEDLSAMTVTVTRSGDTSGAASVDYTTADGSAIQKTDFEFAAGTLTFVPGETSKTFLVLVNEDMFLEGNETFNLTLSNPAGAALGLQSVAMVTIGDDLSESISNPIDEAQVFVYTHYHDFLNREPDAAGLAFWTSQITSCGNDAQCIESARINVSVSFFLSIEFQETAYLLYLMQKESYSTMPKYASFMRDLQEVSRGVVVNEPGWQTKLFANQQQFADQWVNRPEFKAAYDALSNDAYVNALYQNAGLVPPQAERDKLVAALNTQNMNRSAVLLEVAGDASFRQQEQNAAFVLMEYFGYLRRDPNAAPDSDFSGYHFWLNKLNQFDGNYINAEMIKSFTSSFEYRQRFGQ